MFFTHSGRFGELLFLALFSPSLLDSSGRHWVPVHLSHLVALSSSHRATCLQAHEPLLVPQPHSPACVGGLPFQGAPVTLRIACFLLGAAALPVFTAVSCCPCSSQMLTPFVLSARPVFPILTCLLLLVPPGHRVCGTEKVSPPSEQSRVAASSLEVGQLSDDPLICVPSGA